MASKKFRLLYTRTQFFAVEVEAASAEEARKMAAEHTLDEMLDADDAPYLTQDDLIMVDELKRGKVLDG